MVEEGHWVSEPDVAASAPTHMKVIFLDEGKALTNVVQVLRALHDGLKQIILVQECVPGLLPPEIEEVVLE